VRKCLAILGVLACLLSAQVLQATADDKVPRYDAEKLDDELNGNELKARSFKGKTIEVTGRFYGTQIVKDPAGKEAVIVTFQGFADVFQCSHIKFLIYDVDKVKKLRRNDKISVRGKVVLVTRDNMAIKGELVE
jgi:hypothetical protein